MLRNFALMLMVVCCGWGNVARAQGIPVFDAANMTQAIQQISAWKKQYDQMTQQIKGMDSQLKAVTGSRGMGGLMANSTARQSVPTDFLKGYDSLRSSGAAGATSSARSIYDGIKVFGCDKRFPTDTTARKQCEASAMMAPTNITLINQSIEQSKARQAELQSLMAQIDTAEDAKAAADLQNRINTEMTLLQNEKQMMDMALAAQQQQLALTQQQKTEEGVRRVQIGSGKNPFGKKTE